MSRRKTSDLSQAELQSINRQVSTLLLDFLRKPFLLLQTKKHVLKQILPGEEFWIAAAIMLSSEDTVASVHLCIFI